MIIFSQLFQFPRLFFFLLLHSSLLFVNLNQFLLFLILSRGRQFCSCQSSSVVHCRLSLDEEVEMVIVEMEHFFALSSISQSSKQLLNAFQGHDFSFYGVVCCLHSSVLLFKRLFDNAELTTQYLAVSLQRMFNP